MRWLTIVGLGLAITLAQKPDPSIRLEDHSWPDVEPHLRADTVVVVPLGAASKEHGPHLRLRNDLTIAEYLTRRVADATSVVVAPALTYHFFPAFLDYPGSTSLGLETARDMTADVVRGIARHGPRRFYILNTGISTNRPLQLTEKILAGEGILMRYTDFGSAVETIAAPYREQARGSHADEIETSLMLFIAPNDVNMSRAVRDDAPAVQPFRLTRRKEAQATYSPSGVWGDPTRATAEKGAVVAEGLVKTILGDIDKLRAETPPAPAPPVTPPRSGPAVATAPSRPAGCTAGDLREIREIGDAYTYRWSIADAEALTALFGVDPDIIHPDGTIERTREVILANRRELFARREYRNSKHPLSLTMQRCLDYNTAVADGRWSLHSVRDSAGKELPPYEGQVTLVLKRFDNQGWKIEAYRYTMKAAAQPLPTWLKKPGWPGK